MQPLDPSNDQEWIKKIMPKSDGTLPCYVFCT